jgi:hypothetical protein
VKKKKKTPEWYEKRMADIDDFRALITRTSERHRKLTAERERRQTGRG